MKQETKTARKDNPKQMCIGLGAGYAGFGIFALTMTEFQKLLLSKMGQPAPDKYFMDIMNNIHSIWELYMPLLILLGLLFVVFGLFFNRLKKYKYKISIFLGLISLAWLTGYMVKSVEFMKFFNAAIPFGTGHFGAITYIFAGAGLLFLVAMFAVPQYYIMKKFKSFEI